MRTILLTATAALLLGTAGASAASTWGTDAYGRPLLQPQATQQSIAPAQSGVSYGVGYDGHGSATGGPSGGLPGRS